ncbi:MAG: S8 family serine peptidase [Bryobacterales bacterium]|nr:S8 family serine peptidase [Bryobacterales bacterium]
MKNILPIFLATAALLSADEAARQETRTIDAVRKFGVAGRNVLIAILDRGIDWENHDFRHPSGATRLDSIFDLTDRNGTTYTRAQIDAALQGTAPRLPHRDAVGHGTTTMGIAAGNGRNSRDGKYRGYAPKATLVAVKIVAGAPAHDDQPAEPNFISNAMTLPNAIDYALSRAKGLNLPMVVLPNIGSVGGPMDGVSNLARKIDASFGPNIPGLVFVTGSSDDGGQKNHARSTLAQGQSVTLEFDKLDADSLRLEVWYPQTDRYEVTLQTSGVPFGPYPSPATNNTGDRRQGAGFNYFHNGAAVTSYGSANRRHILIDFSGPAGRYALTLRGATATGGTFDAWLNTINGKGEFRNFLVPGYTVWDAAAAKNNICPNNYVLRDKWADTAGVVRGIRQDRIGDLWEGSGIGPTADGRLGVDISAPGNSVFASLAPNSTYAINTANRVQDGNGFYTLQNAVSAANPQVTGIIALMLELNPTLDAAQVKRILQQTARRDAYTGPEPNARWGHGKIDALAALTAASELPGARPYYSVDRNEISLDAPTGSDNPAPILINVTPGNGAPAFLLSSSADWLRAEPGPDPGTVSLSVDTAGLAIADHTAEVTIASADDKAVPQTISVYLHVRPPAPLITSIVDAGAGGPGLANGGRIIIRGHGLAATTREWRESDFDGDRLPTTLDGVRVRVFDRDAFPYYISPNEIRVITPDNPLTNTRFAITVIREGRPSNSFVTNTLPRNPEFFRLPESPYAEARLAEDGTLLSPERPAIPGESIQLYGTGCGPTDPALPTVILTIGGKPAPVSFAGVTGHGICRVDAVVPSDVAPGDAEIIWTIGSFISADAVFLPIASPQ